MNKGIILSKLDDFKKSFQQFGASISVSIIAGILFITALELESTINQIQLRVLINWALLAILAIPLFMVLRFLSNNYLQNKKSKFYLYFIGLAYLIIMYCLLPINDIFGDNLSAYILWFLWNIIFILSISFVIKKGTAYLFWEHNIKLLYKIILSFIFSEITLAAILIILYALKTLFHLNFGAKLPMEIFIGTHTFFGTWLFFAMVIKEPKSTTTLISSIPTIVINFLKNLLLPLLFIYILILFAYGIQSVIQGVFPQGIVCYLIVIAAVVGNLIYLLLFPLEEQNDRYIKITKKIFYIALIILGIIFLSAINLRINQYGFTLDRYFILILGLWIIIHSIYLLRFSTSISFIPKSLALTILIISFGPWGAFQTAERSQFKRLEKILSEHNLLTNGEVTSTNKVSFDDSNCKLQVSDNIQHSLPDSVLEEVESIVNYLEEFHTLNKLNKVIRINPDSLKNLYKLCVLKKKERKDLSPIYIEMLGLKSVQSSELNIDEYNVNSKFSNDVILLNNDRFLIPFSNETFSDVENEKENIQRIKINNKTWGTIDYKNLPDGYLILQYNNESVTIHLCNVLNNFIEFQHHNYDFSVPSNLMIDSFNIDHKIGHIKISHINYQIVKALNKCHINKINGYIWF